MAVDQYKSKRFIENYKLHSANRLAAFMKAFSKILGDYKGKKILDVGCGDGSFTAEIARHGAHVTAIDSAPKMIEECVKNYSEMKNLSFFEEKAQNIYKMKKASFDVVLFNMVLIHIKTKKDLEKIFFGVRHVLKKNGTLIFSDLNPASITSPRTEARWNALPKGFLYLKGGEKFKTHVKPDEKNIVTFDNIHWPPEIYSDVLRETGFCITHIVEPKTEKAAKSNPHQIPSFIVFGCRKV